MGLVFSSNWTAVRQRIRRLPRLVEGVADAQRKRDAHELVTLWRSGIRDRKLHLLPLVPATIRKKIWSDYAKPRTPLYGLGLDGPRTYIKGMRVFKTKNGYRVQMIDGKHHKSNLTLKSLFIVHEYGTTINKKNGGTFRIPSRPAMQRSYEALLRSIARRDPQEELVKATEEFIRTGREELAKKVKSRARAAEARNA
jgi:hypothetical protein